MSAPTFASPGCGLRTNFATTPPHKKARDLAQDSFSPSPSSRSSALLEHDFFPKTGTRARDQALRDVGEQHLRRVLALYAQYHNQKRARSLGLCKDAPLGRAVQCSGTIIARRSCSHCITITCGYDFRKGQDLRLRGTAWWRTQWKELQN
jgi:hypothetical protein